jgi:magnesium-transporting ATPase (P-type)
MNLLKQRNIGTFFGMGKIVIGQVSPYINWISFALVGLMSYYTTVSPIFVSWGIQLPFWVFILGLFMIAAAIVSIEWMFLLQSYFGASNVQSWESENPQRELMEKMERDILENKKGIAEIKKLLEKRNV